MRFFSKFVSFVDRDAKWWGGKSPLIFVSVFPVVLLDLLYDGPPTDAPPYALGAALVASTAIGLFILGRDVIFHIREWRDLRARAERETESDPR